VVFTDDIHNGIYSIVIASEIANFHFQTSLDDDIFDGFTAEVLQASKKGADVRELDGNIQIFAKLND